MKSVALYDIFASMFTEQTLLCKYCWHSRGTRQLVRLEPHQLFLFDLWKWLVLHHPGLETDSKD